MVAFVGRFLHAAEVQARESQQAPDTVGSTPLIEGPERLEGAGVAPVTGEEPAPRESAAFARDAPGNQLGPGATERGWWSGLLALALVIGLLRFWRLGEWSLWVDEVFTLSDALRFHDGIAGNDPKNPLGYGLIALVVRASGGWPSEFQLRLIPALLGYLGIALTAWAFAPFLGKRRAGAAALLLAVSSWHLYWSQNARFYTLAQDLSLLGGGLILRALFPVPRRATPRARPVLLLFLGLLLAGFGALAHPSAALMLPAWTLAALWLPFSGAELAPATRATRRILVGAGLVGMAAMAIWASDIWLTYLKSKPSSSAGHLLLTTGYYFTPLLATAALCGALVAWREKRPVDLFTVALCVSVGLAALASSFFVQASAKYAFALLPWVAALATLPFSAQDGPSSPRPSRLWLLLLILPALTDCALYFELRHGDRPRWREAFAAVWNERLPDDLILANSAPVAEYYLAPRSENLKQPLTAPKLNRSTHSIADHWSRQNRRTWFVLNRELMSDWKPDERASFDQMLATSCRLVHVYPVPSSTQDLTLYVYLRD
jgi:hypothetical protein